VRHRRDHLGQQAIDRFLDFVRIGRLDPCFHRRANGNRLFDGRIEQGPGLRVAAYDADRPARQRRHPGNRGKQREFQPQLALDVGR
jgi:hypothetical protein